MTTNRRQTQRRARQRAQAEQDTQGQLNRRRESMQAAEGHAGSIPRGNQQTEDENLGHRQRSRAPTRPLIEAVQPRARPSTGPGATGEGACF